MASAPHKVLLLADIGGTNARFLLVPPTGVLRPPTVLGTADFPRFEDALDMFLQRALRGRTVTAAAIAAAGPVTNGAVALTNQKWVISARAVRKRTGARRVTVVNDFAALAHGTHGIGGTDLRAIGKAPKRPPPGVRGLIGPGTGLGMATYVPGKNGKGIVLAGEGGHRDLAPGDAREEYVLAMLRARLGHVSAERVLSGPGLVLLYEVLAGGRDAAQVSPPEIHALARRGDETAREAIRIFTGLLGAVAGDLALIVGAQGGVFVAGGIVPGWGADFDAGLFRARFAAKGRASAYVAAIPTYLILSPGVVFRGLRRLARGEA